MAINMAKQRRAISALAPLALLLSPAAYADWKFSPLLEVRETYTDNLRLQPPGRERSEWITEIAPGFTLRNHGRRFKFDASYRFRYFAGLNDPDERVDRTQSQLGAILNAELVDNLLYFDGSASVSQQAISAFEPLPGDNAFSNNRSEVRGYRATPSLRHSFGNTAVVQLSYTHDLVDAGHNTVGTSEGDTLAFNLASGSTFDTLGWNVQASRQQVDYEFAPETTSTNGSVGVRYALGRTFALTANAGHDEYDYQALGGKNGGRSWSAGFNWAPTSRTRVDASAGKRYYGSSYYLNASHRTRRTAWDLHYSDAVTTTRAQYLLPSTVDTAAMLDRLFAATVSDPAQRQRAVEAYMRAAGLPPTLANNINYFSNRYFLQKELRATSALRGVRNTVLLSAFASRRIALSNVDTDSVLLGPDSRTLNDSNRQVGVNLLWNLRLNSRNDMNASASAVRVESGATGIDATHKSARVALVHRFDRQLSGTVEARRQAGPAGITGPGYTENAVSASLNMQL